MKYYSIESNVYNIYANLVSKILRSKNRAVYSLLILYLVMVFELFWTKLAKCVFET